MLGPFPGRRVSARCGCLTEYVRWCCVHAVCSACWLCVVGCLRGLVVGVASPVFGKSPVFGCTHLLTVWVRVLAVHGW